MRLLELTVANLLYASEFFILFFLFVVYKYVVQIFSYEGRRRSLFCQVVSVCVLMVSHRRMVLSDLSMTPPMTPIMFACNKFMQKDFVKGSCPNSFLMLSAFK